MRSILIVIAIFSFSPAFSQKAKIRSAFNYYKEPYQEFDKAKAAIDEAVSNEASKSIAEAWYYRGLIYSALYTSEKYKSLCDHCLETSYESFVESLKLDPKNEWADEIKIFRFPKLMTQIFGDGVTSFNEKKFTEALKSFEYVLKISPGDTSATLNAGISADRGGDFDKAKQYYQELIAMQYHDVSIYLSLSNVYKQQRDSSKALEVVREGRKLFPDTLSLMLSEINLLLAGGHQTEVITALEAAIVKDPKNQDLYLALGSTYDNLANPRNANGDDLPKPANYLEKVSRAEDAYKKGLLLNPNHFEINYNLGALYFNQGAEMAIQANGIKSAVEYEKAKKAYDEKFKSAEPFLEKALEVNPNDRNTMSSLKQLYVRTGEIEKYNLIKSRLENLK